MDGYLFSQIIWFVVNLLNPVGELDGSSEKPTLWFEAMDGISPYLHGICILVTEVNGESLKT